MGLTVDAMALCLRLTHGVLLMQDLMKSAPETPNVVEACNLEGRQERLDGLLSQLEMCEKALQVNSSDAESVCHLLARKCRASAQQVGHVCKSKQGFKQQGESST